MKVLVGENPSRRMRERAREYGWGQMYVYREPRPYEGEPWGFDNGAYLDWRRGREFDRERYLRDLGRAMGIGRPYLAVAPDIVAGGMGSLEFSVAWLEDELPGEWPWYLAVQDGMTPEAVGEYVGNFSGVLLGGTNRFKEEAGKWCEWAHGLGKKFHYARASTERKIKSAIRIGADSMDSAFPLWTVGRVGRLRYLTTEWLEREPRLEFL